MDLYKWAKNEMDILKEKDDSEYACACYASALKAYESMLGDKHSGASFGYSKNLLKRLLDGKPLSPITNEDFCDARLGHSEQCERMSSLFKKVDGKGNITISDVDRVVCVNYENRSDQFSCGWITDLIDMMFPINFPYYPSTRPYTVYVSSFSIDGKDDFDTEHVHYVETPDGKTVEIERYYKYDDGVRQEISKTEYFDRLSKRKVSPMEEIASKLIWTLLSNSADDIESERRNAAYLAKGKLYDRRNISVLSHLCNEFLPDFKLNTSETRYALCDPYSKENTIFLRDHKNFQPISDFLNMILLDLKEK